MNYKFLLTLVSLFGFGFLSAQIPSGYYNSAQGLEGENLREALRSIITSGHSSNSYDDLYYYYETTDNFGSNKVWDMYSMDENGNADYYYYFNSGQECGNYQIEGDCYNREHSVPQSWFNSNYPMQADLFIVVPSDGKVNGQRSNHPYGETDDPSWTSTNGSKQGSCSYPGYSETIFEPIDAYKGDFARGYFYAATRYKNQISGWNGDSFSGDDLSGWTASMLMEWHELDPVSQKEIDRNNAIHDIQGNRNPFIDHPEFVECIWGGGCSGLRFLSTPLTDAMENLFYEYNIEYQTENENESIVCTSLPQWLSFSPNTSNNTAILSGTPTSSDIGNHSVVIELSEDGNTETQSFTITVTQYSNTVNIFDVDFANCPPQDWLSISVSGDHDWQCGSEYYYVNAYNSNAACEDWFISPEIDLETYENETLSFDTYTEYSDDGISNPEVRLYYTDNFTGDPQTTSWIELSYTYPAANSTSWTSSEDIDVSGISGNAVRFAFLYESSGTGAGSSALWQLDNILLIGDMLSSNERKTLTELRVYPNPASDFLYFEGSKTEDKEVSIYSAQGKLVLSTELREQIDISALPAGQYYIRILKDSKCIDSTKFIKK